MIQCTFRALGVPVMSSLMQFCGKVDNKGVHLMCYLVGDPIPPASFNEEEKRMLMEDKEATVFAEALEHFTGPDGNKHIVLYTFCRKPCGMIGCWVQFRYNGKVHAPDLSIPIALRKLPRDAVRMSDEDAFKYWKS